MRAYKAKLALKAKLGRDIPAEVLVELKELERLAEIGKAVETATLENSAWIIDNFSGKHSCPTDEDIKNLISWYRGEL